MPTKAIPLPCPFCGGKPRVKRHPKSPPEIESVYYGVGCGPLNACTVWPDAFGDTRDEAVAKWNTRAPAAGGGRRMKTRESVQPVLLLRCEEADRCPVWCGGKIPHPRGYNCGPSPCKATGREVQCIELKNEPEGDA